MQRTGTEPLRAELGPVIARIAFGESLSMDEAEPALRARIVGTVALLAVTALISALVPLLFARAVDGLAPGTAAAVAPGAIVLAYVLVQWLAKVLSELRWALYGPIEQRTRRRLARHALEHLHALSLSFHLSRRTGQISRVLDQGLNGARELLLQRTRVAPRPHVVAQAAYRMDVRLARLHAQWLIP